MTQFQILNKIVYISLYMEALGKGVNLFIYLLLSYG